MSLPPYLLERLKRRKIIAEQNVEQSNSEIVESPNTGEEIIAEDHSDEDRSDEEESEDLAPKELEEQRQEVDEARTEPVVGCPNTYNIYHNCSQYCVDNYSNPQAEPTLEQRKHLAILLRTFPITNDWTVVFDPGVKTFYFWNIITNLVSWVPPAMNGFISLPANEIRKTMKEL